MTLPSNYARVAWWVFLGLGNTTRASGVKHRVAFKGSTCSNALPYLPLWQPNEKQRLRALLGAGAPIHDLASLVLACQVPNKESFGRSDSADRTRQGLLLFRKIHRAAVAASQPPLDSEGDLLHGLSQLFSPGDPALPQLVDLVSSEHLLGAEG